MSPIRRSSFVEYVYLAIFYPPLSSSAGGSGTRRAVVRLLSGAAARRTSSLLALHRRLRRVQRSLVLVGLLLGLGLAAQQVFEVSLGTFLGEVRRLRVVGVVLVHRIDVEVVLGVVALDSVVPSVLVVVGCLVD